MVHGMFVNIARLINASLEAVGQLTHVTAVSHATIVTAVRLPIVAMPTVVMPTVIMRPDDMLAAAWSTMIVVTAAGFVGRRRHAARRQRIGRATTFAFLNLLEVATQRRLAGDLNH